jgi:hypothetical protein
VNLYRWPGSNPLMIVDPSGLQGLPAPRTLKDPRGPERAGRVEGQKGMGGGGPRWRVVADCGGGWRCVCPGPKPSPGPGAPAGRRVEIWADPKSCDCEKPGDPCTCQMHGRAWQDSQLLKDAQWEAGGT